MRCTIQHLSGSRQGEIQEVEGAQITFGRNPTSSVAFDPAVDLDVSGDHARLEPSPDGAVFLFDLNSRNGTFVNGMRVTGRALVASGAKIKLGANGPEVLCVYASGPAPARAPAA